MVISHTKFRTHSDSEERRVRWTRIRFYYIVKINCYYYYSSAIPSIQPEEDDRVSEIVHDCVLVSSSSHFNSIKIYCQQSYDDLFMLKWNTYSRAQPVPSRLFDMIAVNWFSMSSECQKCSRLDHFNDYLQSDERFSCFCVYFTDGGFKSIRSMFGCLRLFLWWDQREQIFIVSHDLIIWWWSNRLLLICGLRLLRSSSAEPVGNLLSNMFSELRLVIKKPSNIKWNGHRDKIVISRNSRAHTESPALNSYILLPCPHYHVVFHAIICHLLTLILSCLPWLIMFEHWFGAP